jgi:hypothetical protein
LGLKRYNTSRDPRHPSIRKAMGLPPLGPGQTLDAQGERASLPPDVVYYRCRCGGRSTDRDGHPACLAA